MRIIIPTHGRQPFLHIAHRYISQCCLSVVALCDKVNKLFKIEFICLDRFLAIEKIFTSQCLNEKGRRFG